MVWTRALRLAQACSAVQRGFLTERSPGPQAFSADGDGQATCGAAQRSPSAPLPRPEPDRTRRHGRDLPGDRRRLLGRVAVKVLAERVRGRRRIRRALHARGARGRAPLERAEHVTIFDVGEHEGRPVHRHGVPRRRLPRRPADGGRPAAGTGARAGSSRQPPRSTPRHAQGVVHRDVKPANLLLDDDGRVRVADFGVASAAGLDSLTAAGTVLGTAGYLSPEQARGERATPASDRYALGVVAFELLTGSAPVRARHDRRRGGRARARARAVGPRRGTRSCRRRSTASSTARSRRSRSAATRSCAELVAGAARGLRRRPRAARVVAPRQYRRAAAAGCRLACSAMCSSRAAIALAGVALAALGARRRASREASSTADTPLTVRETVTLEATTLVRDRRPPHRLRRTEPPPTTTEPPPTAEPGREPEPSSTTRGSS